MYLRQQDAADRWVRHLHLAQADSSITGDCYPLRAPQWVQVPPPTFSSFSMFLQGQMIGALTGSPVSAETVSRMTAKQPRPGIQTHVASRAELQ